MARPSISVITATHNRRELLLRKLESLSLQTLPPQDFELIVCDDASTDGTVEALRQADVPYPLVILAQGEHVGVARARNRAAGVASSELLLMSDDDCLLSPRALRAHLEAHRRNPNAVVIGALRLPDELRERSTKEPFEQVATLGGRALWINATGANTSIPTSAFRAAGGYDETFSGYGGEDPDLALRLRALGLEFRHAIDAKAYHAGRQLDGNYLEKAFAAGRAHWRVYRRFARAEVGLMLGVHPALLFLKRLAFNDFAAAMFKHARYRYERAYLEGALEERRHGRQPHNSHV